MGRERTRRLHAMQRLSEVNMTPLMDLTFLLLITFMITFPALEQGIAIQLPRASADKIEPLESQTITIDAGGQVFFNNRPVSLEELEKRLAAGIERDPDLSVLIRGDERVAYREIVKVLRILKTVQVRRMALVTEPN